MFYIRKIHEHQRGFKLFVHLTRLFMVHGYWKDSQTFVHALFVPSCTIVWYVWVHGKTATPLYDSSFIHCWSVSRTCIINNHTSALHIPVLHSPMINDGSFMSVGFTFDRRQLFRNFRTKRNYYSVKYCRYWIKKITERLTFSAMSMYTSIERWLVTMTYYEYMHVIIILCLATGQFSGQVMLQTLPQRVGLHLNNVNCRQLYNIHTCNWTSWIRTPLIRTTVLVFRMYTTVLLRIYLQKLSNQKTNAISDV